MTINPNNYPEARTTIVGNAASEPETKFDGRVTELRVGVSQGYKKDGQWVDTGTAWYVVSATTAYAEDNWPYIGKGDKVRVDGGKQEVRTYSTKEGEQRTEIKLTYGDVSVVESKAPATVSADRPF